MISGILLVLILFFLALPYVIMSLRYRKSEKEKQIKKNLLTEILLKKELEDEIEKEIAIDTHDA